MIQVWFLIKAREAEGGRGGGGEAGRRRRREEEGGGEGKKVFGAGIVHNTKPGGVANMRRDMDKS